MLVYNFNITKPADRSYYMVLTNLLILTLIYCLHRHQSYLICLNSGLPLAIVPIEIGLVKDNGNQPSLDETK